MAQVAQRARALRMLLALSCAGVRVSSVHAEGEQLQGSELPCFTVPGCNAFYLNLMGGLVADVLPAGQYTSDTRSPLLPLTCP